MQRGRQPHRKQTENPVQGKAQRLTLTQFSRRCASLARYARSATGEAVSAHADRDGLLGWLRGFARAPGRTFVVHGERETAVGFGDTVKSELGWTSVEVPQRGDAHSIG